MGAAAYNRGSLALSAQIDREQSSVEMTFLRDLSAFSAQHGTMVPFCETVIRFDGGRAYLMNRERGGWGQRSYDYASVWALARRWRLVFVAFGQDQHSRFLRVVPGKAEGR